MQEVIQALETERQRIVREISCINKAIVALEGGRGASRSATSQPTRRKRRKLTTAEKEAISRRMKKSWARRKRKAKAKK